MLNDNDEGYMFDRCFKHNPFPKNSREPSKSARASFI